MLSVAFFLIGFRIYFLFRIQSKTRVLSFPFRIGTWMMCLLLLLAPVAAYPRLAYTGATETARGTSRKKQASNFSFLL